MSKLYGDVSNDIFMEVFLFINRYPIIKIYRFFPIDNGPPKSVSIGFDLGQVDKSIEKVLGSLSGEVDHMGDTTMVFFTCFK
jgi:hypothetical protein